MAKRSNILQKGYDVRTPDCGTKGPFYCMTCGDEMGCEPDVDGATGFAEAMAGHKHKHDRYICPNAGTNWHNQVIKLIKAIEKTPSAELAKIMTKEMNQIKKRRKATKIVHPIF